MKTKMNRRHFISQSVVVSAAAVSAGGLAAAEPSGGPGGAAPGPVRAGSRGTLPTGRIGKLTVSRLISGGNLISGWAHSRDLNYVPALMRAYNTEEKVLDTLQLMEEHGINTIIADPRKKPMDVFARYWKERGGKMQWIAEGHPGTDDWRTDILKSIDFGAAAVYVQGVIGDRWYKEQRLELLAKCVELVKSQKVPAGIGAHKLEVIIEAERQKMGAEFYMKTLHHTQYWSARRPDQRDDVIDNRADNYWDLEPEKTIAFMQEVDKPWIAFKVLAAGAIRPESGFRYAFAHGADFICVGMFDFQVEQNVQLVKQILPQVQNRERAWMG
ncbi:hypothetical protein NXS98_14220 [Fontisphaera persica]|uniref:hypothetical protein n=1 Tax=Fontisphaera persica TaxID=2974023 RepID=UPI0024C09C0C|nr:hypothetical protein [Fontisphaera persica]WCJ58864.1 hypothetical protein NXS98_14220 [Fontisphaera persica]